MNPEETDIFTAVSGWIEYSRQFKIKNQYLYRSGITKFVKSLPESVEVIGQLRKEYFESYLKSISIVLAPSTVRDHKRVIRGFHQWLSQEYGIPDFIPDPHKKLPKKLPILLRADDGTNLVSEWLNHCKRFSPNTQQYYRRAIVGLVESLDIKRVDQLNSRKIELYLNSMLGKVKNITINSYLVAIKSFCRYLFEVYDIPNAAQKVKKLKKEISYQPSINREQYVTILASANKKESDIIKLLANLGLRASELCSLKSENISPNLSSIRIQGKGGKIRAVPCNKTVREILSRVYGNIHFPKNRKYIYLLCKHAGERCNIHLAPHVLRRYFATSLVNKGVSLLIVSKLLGHSSLQTTEIYLKMDFSFLEGCTDVLDQDVLMEGKENG